MAKPINWPICMFRGRYTAMLAASCINHTDQSVPVVIHCAIDQPNLASPTKYFLAYLEITKNTVTPKKKANI